ncbi:MAG: sodium:solute symporter family protein [Myxococcales bacterium]|nr:sodium:solute symporter family protein [Myxococcales bacterium]
MAWVPIVVFMVAMIGLGILSSSQVRTVEDYVVAGRRLGLGLAVPTLLATWFGAGTLLVAADEVAHAGIGAAALDPLGAGICLLVAGVLLARPLWRMQLTTLPEFYGRVFGPAAEFWGSVLMVPSYVGWIAAQYVALAALLTWLTGFDPQWGLALVAAVGILYTLAGGMWAVTLTDLVQVSLMVLGLVVLCGLVLMEPSLQRPLHVPFGEANTPTVFVAALLAGSLGNVPSQDLAQRMFAARSPEVAQLACLLAGVLYVALGAIPVFLAVAATQILDELPESGVLLHLASAASHPAFAVIFAATVASAVLSTIDSAILAPATVLARNLVGRVVPETLALHRLCVLGVGLVALGVAYLGEDAYGLLEASYELGMVSLLVPLVLGVYWPRSGAACIASMVAGTGLWAVHMGLGAELFLGTPIPMGLGCTVVAFVAYAVGPARSTDAPVHGPAPYAPPPPTYVPPVGAAAAADLELSGAYDALEVTGTQVGRPHVTPQHLVWQAWLLMATLVFTAWVIAMVGIGILCFV